MPTIEGIHHFTVPIMLGPDVIGSEVRAQIDGVDVIVALPRVPASFESSDHGPWPQLQAPELQERIRKVAEQAAVGTPGGLSNLGALDWGGPLDSPPQHFMVEACVIRFQAHSEDEARTTGHRIRLALNGWDDILREWLQAMTRQALDENVPPITIESTLSTTRFFGITDLGQIYFAERGPEHMRFTTQMADPASRGQWERAHHGLHDGGKPRS